MFVVVLLGTYIAGGLKFKGAVAAVGFCTGGNRERYVDIFGE